MSMHGNPKVVLFSGGSASSILSKYLESAPVDVTHVLPVFDNGGSTGHLRRAIRLPAVGDLRNRLTTLAATSSQDERSALELFSTRFSNRKSQHMLRHEVESLLHDAHPSIRGLPKSVREDVAGALRTAVEALPSDFPFQELAVGNLLLVGRTLQSGSLQEAIDWARRILSIRSRILPITLQPVHLGVQFENGSWIVGQSELTNEHTRLPGPIRRVRLLETEDSYAFEAAAWASPGLFECLEQADVLIFGFGSFLTSILPHFLVTDVGLTISRCQAPKIFLCNPTADKETEKLTVQGMVDLLGQCARQNASVPLDRESKLVTHVWRFALREDTAIPPGAVSISTSKGLIYESESDFVGFDDIAKHTSERVVALLRPEASERSSDTATGAAKREFVDTMKVVLFDLDFTLFDYDSLRLQATSEALNGVVPDPDSMSSLLAETLLPPLTDVLAALDFPDLRKVWDAPELFAMASLIVLPEMRRALDELRAEVDSHAHLFANATFLQDRCNLYRHSRKLGQKKPIAVLLDRIRLLTQGSDRRDMEAQQQTFRRAVYERARPFAGVDRILTQLDGLEAITYVVTEGDSSIQNTKYDALGLKDTVVECIVTDITCSVATILSEIYREWRNEIDVPTEVLNLYDSMALYTRKSIPFYTKMCHSLADTQSGSLHERMLSPHFLTPDEWQAIDPTLSIIMIGDKYKTDIEPLLKTSAVGVRAVRLLSGKYAGQDPVSELMASGRPVPHAIRSNMSDAGAVVLALAAEFNERLGRPDPYLLDPQILDRGMDLCMGLSSESKKTLEKMRVEAIRHTRTA